MRYFVTRDKQGTVVSLVIGPSEGPVPELDAAPGMATEAIEVGDLDLNLAPPEVDQHLRDIFERFQADEMARRRVGN